MRNAQYEILNEDNDETVTGSSYWVGQIYSASFVVWNGDPTVAGTLKIQCSNDIPVGDPTQFVPSKWADIPNATTTIAAGVAPAIVVASLNVAYIRAVFTQSVAGSTKIHVMANVQGF